jgi:hypothetical protein
MIGRFTTLIVLGGALLAVAGRADAAPIKPIRPAVMPGSDPRTWSPYPLNPRPVMPGSDPRTWSPYPLYPTYNYNPYWLQNPYWGQTPVVYPYAMPYVNPYAVYYGPPTGYLNPYAGYNGNPAGTSIYDSFYVDR